MPSTAVEPVGIECAMPQPVESLVSLMRAFVAGATSLNSCRRSQAHSPLAVSTMTTTYADLQYALAMYQGPGHHESLSMLRSECGWAVGQTDHGLRLVDERRPNKELDRAAPSHRPRSFLVLRRRRSFPVFAGRRTRWRQLRSLSAVALAVLFGVGAMNSTGVAEEEARSREFLANLKAHDAVRRVGAVKSLAALRPVERAAVEGLVAGLADPAAEVRSAARAALEDLSAVEGFSEAAAGVNHFPVLVKKTSPVNPTEGTQKEREGSVLVEFTIGDDGMVSKSRVVKSVRGLDEAALACIGSWLFAPAVKDGRIVSSVAQAPVTFLLYNSPSGR